MSCERLVGVSARFKHASGALQPMNDTYNDILSHEISDNLTRIRMFVNTLRPTPGWGCWTVTALLICHLGLIITVTACYLSVGGPDNLLENVWVAVRQLQSEEVDRVVESSDSGTDRDNKKALKRKGVHERKIGLLLDEEGNSRIEEVAHLEDT